MDSGKSSNKQVYLTSHRNYEKRVKKKFMNTIENIRWNEITSNDIEGQGWKDTEYPFDRLPLHAKELVSEALWRMKVSTNGMNVTFTTNSTSISVRWQLGDEQLGENNFNVCAFSGVDLYSKNPDTGKWQWAGFPWHNQIVDQNPCVTLREDLSPVEREWRLYFPHRNKLERLEIGVDETADFTLIPPRSDKPFVYYGSSIIHGAYAGRAGTGVANLLARRFDLPLINLGFSGAARMEAGVAALLTELDPEFYIIDPLPNMEADEVKENTEKFIEILCGKRSNTDVFMISDVPISHFWLYPEMQEQFELKNRLYYEIIQKMQARFSNLHYICGREFFGSDNEGTIDGIHPNDCGFMRMTDALEQKIREQSSNPV